MRKLALGAITLAIVAGSAAEAKGPRFRATITRTSYGIPHIRAANWGSAGYGIGYAYAEDNLCLLAEEFVTIAGERSLHFGPEAKSGQVDNLTSDVFMRAMIDLPRLRQEYASIPEDAWMASYWGTIHCSVGMLLLRGGQSTKNASETAAGAGGRSRAPSWCRSHWPGRAARAGDGFPAHWR